VRQLHRASNAVQDLHTSSAINFRFLNILKIRIDKCMGDPKEKALYAWITTQLPEILDLYAEDLADLCRDLPDLAPLIAGWEYHLALMCHYTERTAGRPHYLELARLLTAAHAASGKSTLVDADAVCKAYNRFQKRNPHVFSDIQKLVDDFCRLPAQDRPNPFFRWLESRLLKHTAVAHTHGATA
jgi:hypothetical protein